MKLIAPVNKMDNARTGGYYDERTLEFLGLNRKPAISEGEMSDMWNLTSDNYPYLTPRSLRGQVELDENIVRPMSMIVKHGKIAMIAIHSDDSVHFYFDGEEPLTAGDEPKVTGISSSTFMVGINNKICFFPEKKYIEVTRVGNTTTVGEYGQLEESISIPSAPTPNVSLTNTGVEVTLSEAHFKYGDAINIDGMLTYTPSGGSVAVTKHLVASCIIEEVNGYVLTLPRETFIELTGEGAQSIKLTDASLTKPALSRTMPNLSHVIEWNNRLWGCCDEDNVIYACKLGDPTNWQYFQGTGLDSYYAQQGTDETWTGCAVYSGHIIFFKQNSMCRIYGTAPSNYQITNTKCYGVESGSSRSVVVINDKVLYKSVIGIMAYDGGIPYCISDKIHREMRHVVAGTEGMKYYASCQIKGEGFELLVLDIDKAVWHKEDDTRMWDTCTIDNHMYYIESSGDERICNLDVMADDWLPCGSTDMSGGVIHTNPVNPTEKWEDLEWSATFGPFDEYVENKKIYSKLALRVKADEKAGPCSLDVYISLDEGDWELVESYDAVSTKGDFIPIVPRRCDRYSVKLSGKGRCEVRSLTRHLRQGTYGRL